MLYDGGTQHATSFRTQLISLGRLKDPTTGNHILPLTIREQRSKMPTTPPVQNQPDPGRVLPHLAVRSLVALDAVEVCLEALGHSLCGARPLGDAVPAQPQSGGRSYNALLTSAPITNTVDVYCLSVPSFMHHR
jgi:hypothetical protein